MTNFLFPSLVTFSIRPEKTTLKGRWNPFPSYGYLHIDIIISLQWNEGNNELT